MQKYDVVVVLGSQVKLDQDSGYILAPHTKMKTDAAALALKQGVTRTMIISGGYNFGVRYDNEKVLVKPDFSFKAFALARRKKSEAEIMKNRILELTPDMEDSIILEELSATTEENAEFVKIILRRTPTFDGVKTIGILTLLYHMEKALPTFKKASLDVEPLFAENLLAGNLIESCNYNQVDEICAYYSTPKGGRQWKVERIYQLLIEGKNLVEMLS